ncbi:MAG TPA: hypothetical protein VHX86_05595 [Tepidisphaeraceae bacterium]|nr:hypothetical protein [Tepidisphaeraceae bacterium]
MPKRKPPVSDAELPDPARTYERARPEAESLSGRLTQEENIPSAYRDRIDNAVPNKQPLRQLNADDVINADGGPPPETDPSSAHRKTRGELAEQRRAQHLKRNRRTK